MMSTEKNNRGYKTSAITIRTLRSKYTEIVGEDFETSLCKMAAKLMVDFSNDINTREAVAFMKDFAKIVCEKQAQILTLEGEQFTPELRREKIKAILARKNIAESIVDWNESQGNQSVIDNSGTPLKG